ncbi:MAG: hypothetical protein CL946_02805 [Ectothiorhodospiraceae bacterium]|nr:hypothetical protein [Ectothiorhodospiraceae bacterium]
MKCILFLTGVLFLAVPHMHGQAIEVRTFPADETIMFGIYEPLALHVEGTEEDSMYLYMEMPSLHCSSDRVRFAMKYDPRRIQFEEIPTVYLEIGGEEVEIEKPTNLPHMLDEQYIIFFIPKAVFARLRDEDLKRIRIDDTYVGYPELYRGLHVTLCRVAKWGKERPEIRD